MIKIGSIDLFPPASWLKEVNGKTLVLDLFAGLTNAVVVLPQAVAFSIIAGLPPIYGLYTAMIVPIIAALFGSSRHLVSGPTTAISIVIFSTVSQFAEPMSNEFISLAISITLGAGIIQLILGIAGMGAAVNFVNKSVIIGFTAGAAILIITSQLGSLCAIDVPKGSNFLETWAALFNNLSEIDPIILSLGIASTILAILLKQINKYIPHLLLSMVALSLVAFYFFKDHPNINLMGELPKGLPHFSVPKINNASQVVTMLPNMFAIALLGLIEAIAMARSIALMSEQRLNSNQEFFGQGLSNIIGSFFSCFAGTGSFTRSGINYSAGAVTPLASVFAALILMLSISFVAPLIAFLPKAVMSGIIILVAFNLIDFKNILKLIKTSNRESTVMLITFLATLILHLEYAIYLGVLSSLFFYLKQTSTPRFVQLSPDPVGERHSFLNAEKYNLTTCPQLMIYRIEGSLYFGAIESVADEIQRLFERPEKHLLIVGNNINLIDNAGAEYLVNQTKKWNRFGKKIYFSGLKLRSREFLKAGGYVKEIGEDNFFTNKEQAIEEIYSRLDRDVCNTCAMQVFRECPKYKGRTSDS